MSIAWTIVISLISGIISGIGAGLFVTRKISYDNKRMYARQPFYDDIQGRYSVIREYMLQYLYYFKCIAGDIKIQKDEDLEEFDARLNQILLDGLCECLKTNTRQWTSKFGANEISQFTTCLARNIDNAFEFDDLSIKYPLQVYHFDKLYDVSSSVEGLKSRMNNLPSKPSNALIDSIIDGAILTMLSIAQGLNGISSELKYYRHAKPLTWRLFVPVIRN